jgi:hypothetical protein
MKRIILLLLLGPSCLLLKAQETTTSTNIQPVKLGENVNVKFGGFARVDYFFDTRKGKEAVDGLFYMWPEPIKPDAWNRDLNARTNQNLSATPTRFSALFGGPDVLKAKSSAYFEFDFTGGNSNYLLFRQGWVKLEWPKTSILIGRSWHPMQGPVTPSTVALSYECPFNVFCRGEQVRMTYKTGAFTFLTAAFFQSGHASFGPTATGSDPVQSCNFMRNAKIPDLNLQIHYTKGEFTTGIMGEFKMLMPREYTSVGTFNYRTNERIKSYALAAFGQYKSGLFTIKGNAMIGENLAEMSMQGGYARRTLDSTTGYETYSSSNAFTSWINMVYGDKIKIGLLGGYQKNLGFNDNLDAAVYKFYGRGDNIANIWRIAPSISYYSGRMVFQAEPEITSASYGTINFSNKGKITNTTAVYNSRLYLSVSYLF